MIPFSILAGLLVILPSVRRCVRTLCGTATGSPNLPHYCTDADQTVQYTPVTIQLLLPLDTVN